MIPKQIIPIIKLVGYGCNLLCDYCIYTTDERLKINLMSYDTLKSVIEKIMRNQKNCVFIWHGGEPLIFGKEGFKFIVDFQNQLKNKFGVQRINNDIQSNGLLIDGWWVEFFKENNFGVGISLDGPEYIHDRFRKTVGKQSSFGKVLKGVELLKENDIKFGINAVVTKESVFKGRQLIKFFYDLGCRSLSFNHYLELNEKLRKSEMVQFFVTSQEYNIFLNDIYNAWLEIDDPDFSVREIDDYYYKVFGKENTHCQFNGTCGEVICIDYNGDIYPCDCFYKENKYLFGNFIQNSLNEIFNSNNRLLFEKSISKVMEECQECDYLSDCKGGCTYKREGVAEGIFNKKYFYCDTRKNHFKRINQSVLELKKFYQFS